MCFIKSLLGIQFAQCTLIGGLLITAQTNNLTKPAQVVTEPKVPIYLPPIQMHYGICDECVSTFNVIIFFHLQL